MNPLVKKISDRIKALKGEISQLEVTRDTILAYDRGAKRRGKKKKVK